MSPENQKKQEIVAHRPWEAPAVAAYELGRLRLHTSEEPVYFNATAIQHLSDSIKMPERFNRQPAVAPIVSIPHIIKFDDDEEGLHVKAVRGTFYDLNNYCRRKYGFIYPVMLFSVDGANDEVEGNERISLSVRGRLLRDLLGNNIVAQKYDAWGISDTDHLYLDLAQPGTLEVSRPDAKNKKTVSMSRAGYDDIADYFGTRISAISEGAVSVRRSDIIQALRMLAVKAPEIRSKMERMEQNYRFRTLLSQSPETVMTMMFQCFEFADVKQKKGFYQIFSELRTGASIRDLDTFWTRMDELGEVTPSGYVKALNHINISALGYEGFDGDPNIDNSSLISTFIGGGYGLRMLVGLCEGMNSPIAVATVDNTVRSMIIARNQALKASESIVDARAKDMSRYASGLNSKLNSADRSGVDQAAQLDSQDVHGRTLRSIPGRRARSDQDE